MNYGLYLSASGALANMHRQDVLANNLANMNTVGFKPDQVWTRQRLPERLEDPGSFADPKLMLERLGGGLFTQPTHIQFKQGDLVATGNDLDLALSGDGLFVVSDGRGSGLESQRLTRDGRFTLNADGDLVMSAGGYKVLDDQNRPVRLDRSAPVHVSDRGALFQNDVLVGQLRIVTAPAPRDLTKAGDNLLRPSPDVALDSSAATASVRQGYTEASAVDPILTMNAMISAAKAAQGNLKMMQYHDNLLGQAFNSLGRVA